MTADSVRRSWRPGGGGVGLWTLTRMCAALLRLTPQATIAQSAIVACTYNKGSGGKALSEIQRQVDEYNYRA